MIRVIDGWVLILEDGEEVVVALKDGEAIGEIIAGPYGAEEGVSLGGYGRQPFEPSRKVLLAAGAMLKEIGL